LTTETNIPGDNHVPQGNTGAELNKDGKNGKKSDNKAARTNKKAAEKQPKQEPVPVIKTLKSADKKRSNEASAPKVVSIKSINKQQQVPSKEEIKPITKKIKQAAPKKAAAKKVATSKPAAKPVPGPAAPMQSKVKGTIKRITFQIKFHTTYGQSLAITGNHPLLGNNNLEKGLQLEYFNNDYWYGEIQLPEGKTVDTPITYNYFLNELNGTITQEWGDDKVIDPRSYTSEELVLIDSWNHPGYVENTFYTEPFKQVLLKDRHTIVSATSPASYTHLFKVKAPLLQKGEVLCMLGSIPELAEWNTASAVLMFRNEAEEHFHLALDLTGKTFPIKYKYGVYNVDENRFISYEGGDDRILFDQAANKKLTVVTDGFAVLPHTGFKGAGVAIPVFSLRTKNSLGVGEFNDIKPLVDWAKQVGMKVIQILPINDTTATHTFADSYPYAAISAFALHPMYLNIPSIIQKAGAAIDTLIRDKQAHLQSLPEVDYQAVMELKWSLIRQIFPQEKNAIFADPDFKDFFTNNRHWLVPYAAFSYLRDENNTSEFSKWKSNSQYNASAIEALAGDPLKGANEISIHYFIQYHLHLQLQAATSYAHSNGIIVKGDIPIGIYRNSCDAWQQPELYNMDKQAGAPPDDFAVKGQNWGFPTYNWQRMQQDGFTWWKLRFEQMSNYFDAFRIDHILGFFRIWSIPMHAVEGIMGNFVPALAVHINEFIERGINFDRQRFVAPFINEHVLDTTFANDNEYVKQNFLDWRLNDEYTLKEAFNTQRKIEAHFNSLEASDFNQYIKLGLYDLVSNVVLFEAEGSHGQQFHFRISIDQTKSFQYLDDNTKRILNELYINYFFRRQDGFWEREAMHKLPDLKRSTNMLICGEDLGMVPDCVPGVMKRLGILSLEIQRMPKDITRTFFHPADAPYLSVVTPSTHDMSTIRGWWEEDRMQTQQFFNVELGHAGDAPYYCEPWINKEIVLQHLYSPAMWSIFQLQDLLGISARLRRENPNDERINVPANPKHYWRYRMHLPLEQLLAEEDFNKELKGYLEASGR
jgi:4-alpha-glucanotransferase